MRRVFFFMTLALVSVLSIDVSKTGKHSKADQKKLRGTKGKQPAFDRKRCTTLCTERGIICMIGREYKEDKDGTKWCCNTECEPGSGIMVEAPDGLNYCCKQNIQMEASRLTHKRQFEKIDTEQNMLAANAAANTVDLLEGAYYAKSNTIATLEAAVNLQKELEQEATDANEALESRIAKEKAALANEAQTAEAEEERLGAIKAQTETEVHATETQELTMHYQAEAKEKALEEKQKQAKEKEKTLFDKENQIEQLETQQEQKVNELHLRLEKVKEDMLKYHEVNIALEESLRVSTEYTQKCIDAAEVKSNQNKADAATSKMGKEQMDMIKRDLDDQQKKVQQQMAEIEKRKEQFNLKMKEMEENADFNKHEKFKQLQSEMAAEMAKIDEAHQQLAAKVSEMDKTRDEVNLLTEDLNLLDNSKGAMGDESPVTVRFRAMEKKIRDKIKSMEEKCDRGTTGAVGKILVDAKSIKGCTDTNDCDSWKVNLGTAFKGISNLAVCMKAEYDELCGLMTEYKTQQATLTSEFDASKKRTVETVAKTRKRMVDFKIEEKAAIEAAKASDARIAVIQGLTVEAQRRLKTTQDWVARLDKYLQKLGTQIEEVERAIGDLNIRIAETDKTFKRMKKEYTTETIQLASQVAIAIERSKELSTLMTGLSQKVDEASVKQLTAQKALGDDVDCRALAAMDCTKITEKTKCQAPDVAQHCVWQDSDDEMSGGKKNTCQWIDEDSATAIMTEKLFNEDYQGAFYGLSETADELQEEGNGVTSKLDELMIALNEFSVPEPVQIDVVPEVCSRAYGLKEGGCERTINGYTFLGGKLVHFDRNNFGCEEKVVCPTVDQTGDCVPEAHIPHGHLQIDGTSVSRREKRAKLAGRFSCRKYSFSSKGYDMWYKKPFAEPEMAAAKSAEGSEIPAWITQENAGCLSYHELEDSVAAVKSMASVLHTIKDLKSAMQCKIKGIFVKVEDVPFCEEGKPCWHRTAGVCRANYVLDLAMEYLQNDDEYAVSAADVPEYRNRVCVEPPTDYSVDATVRIECGPNVCDGLIESPDQSTVTAVGSSAPPKGAPQQSWSNVVKTGKATGTPQNPGKPVKKAWNPSTKV